MMPLSLGARRFLILTHKFILKYGPWGFYASQRWIAERMSCPIRTVKRWLRECIKAGRIQTKRRSQDTCLYNILSPQMSPQMSPRIKEESATQIETPTESQRHRRDDTESSIEHAARKAAAFEHLSEGDRRYCQELQRDGISVEAIRAGCIVGRVRRMIAESKRAWRDPVRSLRYFAGPISEAVSGAFPDGYVSHAEDWLRRKSA